MARGAFAAEAALAAARGEAALPAGDQLADVLSELIRAAGLVRRIGVNLNQAVARLNATGRHLFRTRPRASAGPGTWTRLPNRSGPRCGCIGQAPSAPLRTVDGSPGCQDAARGVPDGIPPAEAQHPLHRGERRIAFRPGPGAG